jgi:ribonucleoside-diphosphate reductase alpha chain
MEYVTKRNGEKEVVSFDKITNRLKQQCLGYTNIRALFNASNGAISEKPPSRPLSPMVSYLTVAQKVIAGVYDGVETTQLDTLASETAAYMSTIHPDYEVLASRVAVSNLHKETKSSFLEVVRDLRNYVNPKTGLHSPMIAEDVYDIICKNACLIESQIDYTRDFDYSYFGFKSLCKSYLLRINGHIVERPQHMLMRVSIGIHKEDLTSAFETYNLMSKLVMTHATPTLFNAGTPKPQMASCFLLCITEDSIDGIYETLTRCAKISKAAGGIGVNVSNIRASGSYIAGTNGKSNGLTPMLRVYNATARYVDQGGGKRKGAFAIYVEPWHDDIFDVMDLKNPNGADELRARDMFYGIWAPNLFFKRIARDEMWSLMCPHECPGLNTSYGQAFEDLYERYEREGRYRRQVPAMKLWRRILDNLIETGGPYILQKDECNIKSNQKNLGCIRGSNLCTEIIEFTSPDEVATCNLASVSLKSCVQVNDKGELFFDHQFLFQVVKVMTRNLNKVIDNNYYPLPEAKRSNMSHRPIGIGVQGLADVFMMLRYPFESDEAAQLNKDIFETIYFAALTASNELAKLDGPYSSFYGSPASKGELQFDMWNVVPDSGRWDWQSLKRSIVKDGLRNSLLVAPMPTAGTSQILGNYECFEPIDSNMTQRSTSAGNFVELNKYLVRDLEELGLWNAQMRDAIISRDGSIQNIKSIPKFIQDLYKCSHEISQKKVIQLAAGRGPWIDQAQSMNLCLKDEDVDVRRNKLHSCLMLGHELKLKNLIYYLRGRSNEEAKTEYTQMKRQDPDVSFGDMAYKQPSSLNDEGGKRSGNDGEANMVCTREKGCFSCGS